MKLGVLFSGGKDSVYATYLAQKDHEITCLITLESKNKESYMFHTPNISLTKLQADALGIPRLVETTSGEKETELTDLQNALQRAKDKYGIEGVVTGAIESVYQGTRVQKICKELNLWCFNPLWKIDQVAYMQELLDHDFSVMVVGVFAYPFDEKWLGRIIDQSAVDELIVLQEKFKINPSGEGGEIETAVVDAPHFSKKLVLKKSTQEYDNYSGTFTIIDAEVHEK